jgi:hypothetical protein
MYPTSSSPVARYTHTQTRAAQTLTCRHHSSIKQVVRGRAGGKGEARPHQHDSEAATMPVDAAAAAVGASGSEEETTLAVTLLFALAVPVATFVLLYNHSPWLLRGAGGWVDVCVCVCVCVLGFGVLVDGWMDGWMDDGWMDGVCPVLWCAVKGKGAID